MNRVARGVLAVLVTGVALFLFSGLSQALPWGVPTAQAVISTTSSVVDDFAPEDAVVLPANALTTERFDAVVEGRVNTLTTDDTFSWIISIPVEAYDPATYLGLEAATQFAVGALLVGFVWSTRHAPLRTRLGYVAGVGVLAVVATYGRLMNWWGLPAGYALGESVNLLGSWVGGTAVASFVLFGSSGSAPHPVGG